MIDREKVQKGLECCCGGGMCFHGCPYHEVSQSVEGCTSQLASDALELLKEQQETISSFQGTIRKLNAALEEQAEIVRCGECIYHHYENNRIPYCELIDYGYGWHDDDFCSRGKKR